MNIVKASMRRRVCPVCNHNNLDTLYKNDLAELDSFDMSYGITTCDECHFIYANTLPEAQQYDTYYGSLSKYDVVSDQILIPPVDQYRAKSAVEFCQPYLDKDALIADLGCGSGILLNAFQEVGWVNVYGLDPAPNANTKAKEMFSLNKVYTGTLEQAADKLPLPEIDLVCLMGVLEHLAMLREDLEELVKHLSNNAKIVIEVPAVERFCKTEMEPYGEFSLEHIQFFSAETLIKLMESLGFQPIAITYLELSKGSTDSLLCLFGKSVEPQSFIYENTDIELYLSRSDLMAEATIQRIKSCAAEKFIIYGAGSHTARLLPKLDKAGISDKVLFLVDTNINLQGKTMGGLSINLPDELASYPNATVIISSFRSQDNIAGALKEKYSNPLLLLY